jgi:hypothetical protein
LLGHVIRIDRARVAKEVCDSKSGGRREVRKLKLICLKDVDNAFVHWIVYRCNVL